MKYIALLLSLLPGWMAAYCGGEDSACKKFEQLSYVYAELNGFGGAQKYIDSMGACGGNLSTQAHLLYKEGKYAEALSLYLEYIKEPGTGKEQKAAAYNYAGICAHKTKQYAKALEYYALAEKTGFGKAATRYNMGITHYDAGNYDKAIAEYKTALQYNENNADVWNNLGATYNRKGDINLALQYHATAYRLSKNTDPLLMINYSKLLRKVGKYDSAFLINSAIIEKFPSYYQADIQLATQYNFDFHKPQLALVHARRAVAAAPANDDAIFELAAAKSDLGEKDSALYYYTLVLHLDPGNYAAYDNIGQIYKLYGYFDKAIECYNKSLEINPGSHYALGKMASAYLYSYDFENALKYYLLEYKVSPDLPERALGLGYAYLQAGKYNEAIPYLKEAMIGRKQYRDVPLNNLGLTFLRFNNTDSAKYYLDSAFSIDPKNSYIYHNRALYYYKINNYQAACQDLKTALDLEYNWIIDSALQKMAAEYCKEINLNRVIKYHAYKGYVPEYADRKFIEIVDSLSLSHYETLKPIAAAEQHNLKLADEKPAQVSSFRVYPNPAGEMLNITYTNGGTGAYSVDIYNSNGQKVYSSMLDGTETRLNLAGFAKGLYVAVVLQNNNVVHTEKVILE